MTQPRPTPLNAGDSFELPHPFIREEYTDFDGEGYVTGQTWRPGVRPQDTHGDQRPEMVADGRGVQLLKVVGIFKPEGFSTRVFYTRRWRDPDGKEFGKHACRVTSLGFFRTLLRGYRYPVEIAGKVVA